MASWYRQFLDKDAALAKSLIASALILHSPMLDKSFVIQTDTSNTGIGVVLTQEIDEKKRVIEFASKVLTSTEHNYTVCKRECLAVIFAVRKFRQYIESSNFKVMTDHSSLC